MPLSCYVPSQIIPKSRVVHLADKQILKRHILSYPKITVSKNLPLPPGGWEGWEGWVGGRRVSIPGPWTKRDSDTVDWRGIVAIVTLIYVCGTKHVQHLRYEMATQSIQSRQRRSWRPTTRSGDSSRFSHSAGRRRLSCSNTIVHHQHVRERLSVPLLPADPRSCLSDSPIDKMVRVYFHRGLPCSCEPRRRPLAHSRRAVSSFPVVGRAPFFGEWLVSKLTHTPSAESWAHSRTARHCAVPADRRSTAGSKRSRRTASRHHTSWCRRPDPAVCWSSVPEPQKTEMRWKRSPHRPEPRRWDTATIHPLWKRCWGFPRRRGTLL